MDLPIQSKRILVVEDSPEMRRSVASTLQLEHYQVDRAENARRLWPCFSASHPT
jgi:DNA-binding response OmpR family regulator